MTATVYELQLGSEGSLRLQASTACTHLEGIKEVEPSGDGCIECLQTGDAWVHLRLCRICGHVGCCDSSKNRHATKHFHETTHEIIQSFQRGEDWMYCYPDDAFIEVL